MARFEIDYVDDEYWVLVDTKTGEEIDSASHDEDGWHGMHKLEELAETLNDKVR